MKLIDMLPNQTLMRIFESWWIKENPLNTTDDILDWIEEKNKNIKVSIDKIPINNSGYWYYDKEEKGIVNRDKTFFQIKGLSRKNENEEETQPIIIQNEIGYLGVIGKTIGGVLYFLMQAKIEPGNINKIQISPTIQATKSNFMQTHGGKVPAYLEYFSNKKSYEIVVDQIQSEQSSFFLAKRNRNIIIIVNDDVDVLESHKWMTLGQVKELMRHDNLVNMDTRTVFSCIPFSMRDYTYKELGYIKRLFGKDAFFNSVFLGGAGYKINQIYQYINEIKMLDKSQLEIVDLYTLKNWHMENNEFVRPDGEFKIIFCDIAIEGREVQRWEQPLFEPVGESLFGLICCVENNIMKFLVQTISEIGCFDKVEIGPSVQLRVHDPHEVDEVKKIFVEKMEKGEGVLFSGIFSEEGGRFYHSQNRNVLLEIDKNELSVLPDGYFWADYQTLNTMIQFNNCLNIQLRNLLSIIDL